MKRLILIVAITELCLFITTRIILYFLPAWAWETELLRTFFRGVATIVYWYYFREMIFCSAPSLKAAKHPLFISSIMLLLATPLLVGDLSFMGTWAKITFALTSIVVGLHEEFLFRGIIQNSISKRVGLLYSILITSGVMTAWHIGVVSFTLFGYAQIFIISCLLGVVYAKSRSIWLVVALHAIYDALWSLTPVLSPPFSFDFGLVLLLVSLVLAVVWFRR